MEILVFLRILFSLITRLLAQREAIEWKFKATSPPSRSPFGSIQAVAPVG
jgi:hypothetical protein